MYRKQYFFVFACMLPLLTSCPFQPSDDSNPARIGKLVASVSITERDGEYNKPYPMVLSHVFRRGHLAGSVDTVRLSDYLGEDDEAAGRVETWLLGMSFICLTQMT